MQAMLCDSISLLWSWSLSHLTSLFGLLLCDSSAMTLIFIIHLLDRTCIAMLDTAEDRRCNNQQLKKELTLFCCSLAAPWPSSLAGHVVEEVVMLCDGFDGS